MNGFEALRRLGRRVALAYHLICAREERVRRGIALPAGLWVCQVCRLVSLDERQHTAHACAAA